MVTTLAQMEIKTLRKLLRWALYYAEHSYGGFPPKEAATLRKQHKLALKFLRDTAPRKNKPKLASTKSNDTR